MLQPQSDEEIRPVIEALQKRLDPLLDIQWCPKAILREHGAYSVLGVATPPEYDGRWEVIRWDTSVSLHKERTYTRIMLVTELDTTGKYPITIHEGAYMPIGWWLVGYMQLWDAAQSHFATAMDHLWEEHEKIDAPSDDFAAHEQAAQVVWRKSAGQYWMGGAQGRAAPETEPALWPATK